MSGVVTWAHEHQTATVVLVVAACAIAATVAGWALNRPARLDRRRHAVWLSTTTYGKRRQEPEEETTEVVVPRQRVRAVAAVYQPRHLADAKAGLYQSRAVR